MWAGRAQGAVTESPAGPFPSSPWDLGRAVRRLSSCLRTASLSFRLPEARSSSVQPRGPVSGAGVWQVPLERGRAPSRPVSVKVSPVCSV